MKMCFERTLLLLISFDDNSGVLCFEFNVTNEKLSKMMKYDNLELFRLQLNFEEELNGFKFQIQFRFSCDDNNRDKSSKNTWNNINLNFFECHRSYAIVIVVRFDDEMHFHFFFVCS